MDLSIHNVKNIEIEKYQLDSGTWVCKIDILTETRISKQITIESLSLFTQNKQLFKSLRET